MNIDISKLKEGGILALEHAYDAKALNLELYDLHYLDLLQLNGKLERVGSSLFFKGLLNSQIEMLCTRCLKTVRQAVSEPFDLYYPYKGEDFLETTDDIREVMILSYPVKFICQEDCKGLCPHCGTNLNEEKCSCKREDQPLRSSGVFDRLDEWYKSKSKKKKR